MAAVIVPGGAVPVGEIPDLLGSSSPTDIFSLLESGRFYELWRFYDDVAEDEDREALGASSFSRRSSTAPSTGGRARSGVSG